ncbi:hypothetical protein GQ457_01G026870 [Hibiscus cannabinus]
MSWWWSGAIGAARNKFEENETPSGFQSVALVIGVTGIVGNNLAEILPFPTPPAVHGKFTAWLAALGRTGTPSIESSTSSATYPIPRKPSRSSPNSPMSHTSSTSAG